MSIFKTTFKVESTNSTTAPINFTASVNNELTDDIVFSKISVNSNLPVQINPANIGAKGSYLYVKSSAANPKHTAINIFFGQGEEISTLYTGEFAVIPLSNKMYPLNAVVTQGTAELEYFFGSRGEEIGENVLIKWRNTGTNTWWFQTLDAATGTPGQQVNTSINYDDYPYSTTRSSVNRKGYVLDFYNGNNNHNLVFVNSKGLLETTRQIDYSLYTSNGDGRANLIQYVDNNNDAYIIYFDGDSIYEHTFVDVNYVYVDDNWDDCAADGTFPLYVEGLNGDDLERLYLIKGANKTLIKTTNYNGNDGEYSNAYVYSHGNFIAVEKIYDDGYVLSTIEIFSTDGTLLKTVDFDNMSLNDSEFRFYGSGKLQIVVQNNNTNEYTFLNYNQLTGKLIGEDLQWKSTYNSYEIVARNYYTGYSQDYKPESVAIVLYYNDGINSNYFLDQATDGALEVTYIINNDLVQRNYVVPYTENDYFVSNDWNTRMFATINDFVLFSADNRTTGSLTATRFSSGTEPTKYTIVSDLSIYDMDAIYDGGWVNVECFGDYRLLSLTRNTGGITDIFVHDGLKVLDTIQVTYNAWDSPYRFNSLAIFDYLAGKRWYFNTSTKKFVLLTGTFWEYATNGDQGDQYPVSDGKILMTAFKNNTASSSLYGRILTKGAISNEKELLRFGNAPGFEPSWLDIIMSTETIVVLCKEYYNSTFKARVFDLNLNFLYEVDTQKNEFEDWWTEGKLNFMIFYDNGDNNNNKFYNFNKLLNLTELYTPSGWDVTFNNAGW